MNFSVNATTTHKRTRQRSNRFDILSKKCKRILLDKLRDFINQKIKEIYNNDIGKVLYEKQLMRINGFIREFLYVKNKKLMTKTLLEIFSFNNFYTHNPIIEEWNKKLIEELLNEKDDDKRYYFENLFNLYFLECIEHFTNKRTIDELQGLKTFNEIKNDKDELKEIHIDLEDKDYLDKIEYYFNHFEEIIDIKSQRKKRIHR